MKEKKTDRMNVRVSQKELAEIKKKANKLNMPVSTYFRTAALNQRIVIKTDKEMVLKIRDIGDNINRIAHQLNMHSDDLTIADAYSQMEKYKQTLQCILDDIAKK